VPPAAQKLLHVLLAASLALAAPACGGGKYKPVDLPLPVQTTTLGIGDVFELYIVGEERLPKFYTVASNGTADLPYIKRTHVVGLEPEELAELVRKKLMEGEILTNPDVSVSVKEYNSKRVEVLGEVQKPGSLPLQPGMTLLRAISLAGGFNSIADKDEVTIRRKVKGGVKAVTVSVDAIIDNKIPDVPLQAGDSINIAQRVF
jgi:protein involved in polysaccharide export with SLBB domain